ncbi:alpha/beta fold hydrolase [Spongisporangium articulatum]|uniref:Alpha/beta fold hydrolase n=1 Tax=Spongisporangium articulatum TaxID=3362603 RepID=A0ABW8AQC5_9ACTN
MSLGRASAIALSLAALAGGFLTVAPGPASAAGPAPSPSTGGYPPALVKQKLTWSECYPDAGYPELLCAAVKTPQDWARPNGPTITVAISRIVASDPAKRRGVLFTNPGGPGGSGIALPLSIEYYEPDVAAAYDVIGLDPRGVGASTPNLDCGAGSTLGALYDLDGRDTSAANQKAFRTLDVDYANQCSKTPLARYITTAQTVRDFDLVRAVLGEKKISYVGFSFGTWIGASYASVFPDRTDRFVLDGNIDFSSSTSYSSAIRQPLGFQNSYQRFLEPWIAKYDGVYGLGATAKAVHATLEKRRAQLAKHALPLADGSTLTASGYDSGIIGALYYTGYYDSVATPLSILERYATATDDEKQVVADWFGSGSDGGNGDDVFWATECQDTPSPSYARVVDDTNRFRTAYPLAGANWNAYPCPFFTLPTTGSQINSAKLPPLLMLNNTDDPATPLANAVLARAHTPNARLVVVKDQPDHTIYAYGDDCADGYANTFLLQGRLPAKDTTCPGRPLPEPAALEAPMALSKAAARADGGAGMPIPVWVEQFNREHGPAVVH